MGAGARQPRGRARAATTGTWCSGWGEQSGQITSRSEGVAQKLDNIDAAYATDNLWGERWAKLCQNGMGNAISAMTAQGSQEMAQDARFRMFRIQLAKEGAQVGLAQGLNVVAINGIPAQTWADADKGEVFEELNDIMSKAGVAGSTGWPPWPRTSTRAAIPRWTS